LKKFFYLLCAIFIFFPIQAKAVGFFFPENTKYKINQNIATFYFNNVQTTYFSFEFETSKNEFAALIPVNINSQVNKSNFDFDVLDNQTKVGYSITEINKMISENKTTQDKILDNFSLETISEKDVKEKISNNNLEIINRSEIDKKLDLYKNHEFILAKFNLENFHTVGKSDYYSGQTKAIKVVNQTSFPQLLEGLFSSSINQKNNSVLNLFTISENQLLVQDFGIEYANWVEEKEFKNYFPDLDPDLLKNKKKIFLTKMEHSQSLKNQSFDWQLIQSNNQIFGEKTISQFEKFLWVFIFSICAILYFIFNIFSILVYFSIFMLRKAKHSSIKILYFTLLFFGLIGILFQILVAWFFLNSISPILINVIAYYLKYNLDFLQLYSGVIIGSSVYFLILIGFLIIYLRKK